MEPFKSIPVLNDLPAKFRGRMGVKDFWKGVAVNILVSAVLYVLILFIFLIKVDPAITFLFSLSFFLVDLYFLIVALSLTVRRLHDLNNSGLWAILLLGLYFGGKFLFRALEASPNLLGIIVPLWLVVSIVVLVYVGFKKGKPEENRFGLPQKYNSWWGAFMAKRTNTYER